MKFTFEYNNKSIYKEHKAQLLDPEMWDGIAIKPRIIYDDMFYIIELTCQTWNIKKMEAYSIIFFNDNELFLYDSCTWKMEIQSED